MKVTPPKTDRERSRLELQLTRDRQAQTGIPCRVQVFRTRYGWATRTVLIRDQTQLPPP